MEVHRIEDAAKDPSTPGSVSTEGNGQTPASQESPTDRSTFEASALRISFQNGPGRSPLPRDPDSRNRLKYSELGKDCCVSFSLQPIVTKGISTQLHGQAERSGRNRWLIGDRTSLLNKLGLPLDSGPAKYWLTEFEDRWRYEIAPSDLYFSKSKENIPIDKPPVQRYSQSGSGSFSLLAIVGVLAIPALYLVRLKSERFATAT